MTVPLAVTTAIGGPDDPPPQTYIDMAFRAGMLEATRHAEERYRLVLLRCDAVEAERDKLLAIVQDLQCQAAAPPARRVV